MERADALTCRVGGDLVVLVLLSDRPEALLVPLESDSRRSSPESSK